MWSICHMLSEGVLVDAGTFLCDDCYLGSSGKTRKREREGEGEGGRVTRDTEGHDMQQLSLALWLAELCNFKGHPNLFSYI